MEEKIKIIDEIVKRHPSYGVDKGWSHYTGGMADTGDWYFRKMIDVPIEELVSFLNKMIEEENRPRSVDTDIFLSERAKQFFRDIERKLMTGK